MDQHNGSHGFKAQRTHLEAVTADVAGREQIGSDRKFVLPWNRQPSDNAPRKADLGNRDKDGILNLTLGIPARVGNERYGLGPKILAIQR